jgi:alpha-tubulin suppressor-like RCC1 family protein
MEGNDMRVDRQPRIRAARRDNIQHTPFMRDITSMRQQLVERQNEQFSHQLTKINGGSTRDEEKGNLIAQLAAENVRVYRSIDAHYPDRELGADVVGMGNDDTMSLGIRQDEDELVKSEYPPTIARNIPQRVMVDIAAGGTHSATLHTDGTVYTFGSNDDGQLGRYDIQEGLEFKAGKVVKDKSEKPLERITEIHAGDSHTLMKDDKGNVFFVGMYKDTDSGKWRPMPEGSNESIKGSHKHAYHIELPRPAKYIASGFNFSAAVLPAADDHNGLADELYTWYVPTGFFLF